MNISLSNRLQKLPPYLFADLRRQMRDAEESGTDVIRIDIGDPDTPTPDPVAVEACRAPSILEVDGADDVAVEFCRLSKGFNMTGWRVGFVAGNRSAVSAPNQVKENVDNGTPRPVQHAARVALDNAEELSLAVNSVYQRRRDSVVHMFQTAGWSVSK